MHNEKDWMVDFDSSIAMAEKAITLARENDYDFPELLGLIRRDIRRDILPALTIIYHVAPARWRPAIEERLTRIRALLADAPSTPKRSTA